MQSRDANVARVGPFSGQPELALSQLCLECFQLNMVDRFLAESYLSIDPLSLCSRSRLEPHFRFLKLIVSSMVPKPIVLPLAPTTSSPTSSPYRTLKALSSTDMFSTVVNFSRRTSRSISVLPLVAVMICKKPPSTAGVPLRDSDQIAITAKAVAATRQMLYGRMRFSGLAKEYILW